MMFFDSKTRQSAGGRSAVDGETDHAQRVYQLYGLTEDEFKIVEGNES